MRTTPNSKQNEMSNSISKSLNYVNTYRSRESKSPTKKSLMSDMPSVQTNGVINML